MFHVKTGSIVVSKKKSGGTPLSALISSSLAAYSLRLLNLNYTGYCIKVRRDSDNTTQDIGFTSGAIDTTSLLSFVGSNNGYVDTIYDQSGNSNNTIAVETNRQPKIVSSGSVITYGGKPAISFNGSNFMYRSLGSLASNTNFTQNAVGQGNGVLITISGTSGSNNNSCLGAANTSVFGGSVGPWFGGFAQDSTYAATAYANANNNVLTKTFNGSTVTGYMNGVNIFGTETSYSLTGPNIVLGVQNFDGTNSASNTFLTGYLQEATAFLQVLSDTDRQLLEQNQENYYGITGI